MYTVEMRVRGNRVRVYSGSSYTLRFTATASGFSGGYAGYRSDNTTVCELLRLGDAWTYEPYERFDVEMPDGSFKSYGRISRTNCTWDEEFQVFTLTSDVEETSTRSEDISLDYDFFHSDLLEISCGGNYTAKVIPKDINIWIRCPAGPPIQKQAWQPVSPRPHPPTMVPLPSHRLKQWGQLGEILGGVRFPECGARRSLAVRPGLGK